MPSGYRLMWMMVMFDLPVASKTERKAATGFRQTLLDLGFEMSQFSVYLRFCTSQAQVDSLCGAVAKALPTAGKIHILQFTDKQYERVITYCGRRRRPPKAAPGQLALF